LQESQHSANLVIRHNLVEIERSSNLRRFVFSCLFFICLVVFETVTASPASATITALLTPSIASPQLVGTTITWTATATDNNPGTIDFQFSVEAGSTGFQVLQDYDVSNLFVWTPYLREGKYTVQVIARNLSTNETSTVIVHYGITSRVTAGVPVLSATNNPLVALYSAPQCAVGSSMYVVFSNGSVTNQTSALPCQNGLSMNFYIGGMYPSTTYTMYDVLVTGTSSTNGPKGTFTTGAIPAGMPFPVISVAKPAGSQSALTQSVLLIDSYSNPLNKSNLYYIPFATDLAGKVIWYYPAFDNAQSVATYFIRPVAGGTFLVYPPDENTGLRQQLFREIDMAGNAIRQTSITRINQQLALAGQLPVAGFNHDAIRLPNGHTIVKASQEGIFPAGTQGSIASVDILGDCIMDLDTNMQLVWSWSAFDNLNVNQVAPLGETCTASNVNCPPISLAPVANDWTHMNSLNYIPSNGDLLISTRNIDSVFRIDYNNGTGTGNVVWTLGPTGDFTMTGSTDPWPWFEHQHDVEYELNGTSVISLFDNGNERVTANPGETSRGQVLNIDESAFTVSLQINVNMSGYSSALGSAQRLDNGDYHFLAGWLAASTNSHGESYETTSTGGPFNFELIDVSTTYRSYRMDSLYELDAPSN
jgi:arylsulfate sulfotransferase